MLPRLLLFVLLCSVGAAAARDNGQFTNVPEHIRQWFNEQRSPEFGALCCTMADGSETQEDIRSGQYWATIQGKWYPVPPSRVIHQGNPVGHPVIWYTDTDYGPIIMCFVPGPGL